jgi:hypothetical protein
MEAANSYAITKSVIRLSEDQRQKIVEITNALLPILDTKQYSSVDNSMPPAALAHALTKLYSNNYRFYIETQFAFVGFSRLDEKLSNWIVQALPNPVTLSTYKRIMEAFNLTQNINRTLEKHTYTDDVEYGLRDLVKNTTTIPVIDFSNRKLACTVQDLAALDYGVFTKLYEIFYLYQ